MFPKIAYFADGAKSPTLKEAQEFVDGYVQIMELGDMQMLVNEEGMFREDLEVNHEATQIAKTAPVQYLLPPQGLKGNAIILTGDAKWR